MEITNHKITNESASNHWDGSLIEQHLNAIPLGQRHLDERSGLSVIELLDTM